MEVKVSLDAERKRNGSRVPKVGQELLLTALKELDNK
jgi:hypothetical protein